MGSITPSFPDKSSPDLILAHPTESERRRTWSMTHPKWGPALSEDEYLNREAYALTLPLARDGGLVHWILTDRSLPDERPILSSCETLRKRAVRTTRDEEPLVEGIVYGVGSVFTDPLFRGRGYADRMLRELGRVLSSFGSTGGAGNVGGRERVLCSILYSDIGKVFYAKRGWAAFPSRHVALPVRTGSVTAIAGDQKGHGHGGSNGVKSDWIPNGVIPGMSDTSNGIPHGTFPNGIPNGASLRELPNTISPPPSSNRPPLPIRTLTHNDLPSLCSLDEHLLRQNLTHRAHSSHPGSPSCTSQNVKTNTKTSFALLPTHPQLLWHLLREAYMTARIFGAAPRICGATTQGPPGRRIWAVWSRSYYAGCANPEKNTLHVLRIRVEDWGLPRDELVEGLKGVLGVAQREAGAWWAGEVQVWNLEEGVEGLLREGGVEYEMVEREEGGIPSLMWYGEEGEGEVEWVANERFAWC